MEINIKQYKIVFKSWFQIPLWKLQAWSLFFYHIFTYNLQDPNQYRVLSKSTLIFFVGKFNIVSSRNSAITLS